MLYRHIPKVVSPSTQDHALHVRRISKPYELSAMRRNDEAVDAAGFDVTFYRQLASGLACTCHNDPKLDVLDADGNMDADVMQALTSDIAADFGHDIVVSMSDYEDIGEKDEFIETNEEFLKFLKRKQAGDDYKVPQVEQAEEYLERQDNDDEENVLSPTRALSAFSSNCPVCSRTGLVGGHTLVGGYRRIIDSQQLTDLQRCGIDAAKSPHRVESALDSNASDNQWSICLTPEIILPKDPYQVQSLQVYDGYKGIYNENNVQVHALVGNSKVQVRTKADLLTYCDGHKHRFEIRFRDCGFTHMEIQIRTRAKPTCLDLSNYSRSFTPKSVNDIDPVQVTIPGYIGRVRRGDLFCERTSGLLWILTAVESLRSADRWIGHSGTASRVRSSFEPYTIYNPYATSDRVGLEV